MVTSSSQILAWQRFFPDALVHYPTIINTITAQEESRLTLAPQARRLSRCADLIVVFIRQTMMT
jgi:hypothetical protein